jgi:hypothetical protein
MNRLIELLSVFIFLGAVLSNCVTDGLFGMDPIATALDDFDSADASEPVKMDEPIVLFAQNPFDATRKSIVVREVISPVASPTIRHPLIRAAVVVTSKRPPLLRI